MAGVRRALIVATDKYGDPKLTDLNAPANDARALAELLRDETVGGFEVTTVLNRASHEVALAIAEFFAAGKFGDTLLAHFSCHGVKSPSGELYFATTNTDLSDTFRLKVTGVPSAQVREAMEESRASLILCLVDCCYSGAFVKLAKAADTLDLTERLGGKGRAVITASTALQLALDGEEEPSLFTHAVIEGLSSGEADRDLDGLVSLDELYSYVHERVTSRNPNQTPVKSFDVQGEVYVARRSTPVTRPAKLDPDLLADATAPVVHRRLGAVHGLAGVLAEKHPGRSLAARLELVRMAAHDDSLSVRDEAQQVLDGAGEPPTPVIPDYEATVATRGGPVVDDEPRTEGVAAAERGPDAAGDPDAAGEPDATGEPDVTDGPPESAEPADEGRPPDDRSTPPHPGGVDEPGADQRWGRLGRRPTVVAAGAVVVALLAAGGLALQARDAEDGTDGTTGETAAPAEPSGPVLPETEILVGADDPQLGRGIFAFDVATGNTRPVIDDPTAAFPTISEDRQWITYLTQEPGVHGGVPRLARIDGSDDARLLDAEASDTCPFTTRPAFEPDGPLLAVKCVDADRETIGLRIVDREGRLVRTLLDDADIEGAPTWTDDDRLVFARREGAGGTQALWAIAVDGGQPAEPVTDGLDGSDSHPDWSEHGLLFLRDRDGDSDVVYKETVDARGVTPLSTSGTARSPTWGPASQPAVVWLQRAAEGAGKTLWARELGDDLPWELNTGDYGAPAWGSR